MHRRRSSFGSLLPTRRLYRLRDSALIALVALTDPDQARRQPLPSKAACNSR